jgi:hypothetical protein
MAWREVTIGDTRWSVSAMAERVANVNGWRLILAYRAPTQRASIWAPYPIESSSKAMIYAQAERIPPEKLAAVLAERIG